MRMTVSKEVAKNLVGLTKKDFKVQYFRASGPGGQHKNKKDTAARITHLATGISAEAVDSRSQATNKKNAFIRLVKKMVKYFKDDERGGSTRRRVRTYNEHFGVAKDHRSGVEITYDEALNGEIEPFVEAMIRLP